MSRLLRTAAPKSAYPSQKYDDTYIVAGSTPIVAPAAARRMAGLRSAAPAQPSREEMAVLYLKGERGVL